MIKKIIKILLILLFISLSLFRTQNLLPQLDNIRQLVNQEPQDKTYFSDEKNYLKIFYLMKKGEAYYPAYLRASQNLAGPENSVWSKDLWGWRLPTVFYFWTIVAQNGVDLFYLFIFFTIITLLNSYLITKKFTSAYLAFLSPLILVPYYLNAIKSTSFLFLSWWASFFFIIGLTSFFYQKRAFSALFFTLAAISREHFIIPLTILFIISLLVKKNRLVFFLPLIIFLIVISFHALKVSSLIRLENPIGLGSRLNFFSKKLFLAAMSFSTNSYLLVNLRPSYFWLGFSFIGLTSLIYQEKKKYLPIVAFVSLFSLVFSLPFMGGSVWEDYWGAMYVPLAAIFSLTIFRVFL